MLAYCPPASMASATATNNGIREDLMLLFPPGINRIENHRSIFEESTDYAKFYGNNSCRPYVYSSIYYDIYKSVIECLNRKSIIPTELQKNIFRQLISTFSNLSIIGYSVDYGRKYKALILNILMNDGWKFRVRCETDETNEQTLTFCIEQDSEIVFEGSDNLADFQSHVHKFFSIINKTSTRDGYEYSLYDRT